MGEAKNRKLRYEELDRILSAGSRSEIRTVIDEVTKMLTDRGQLIEAGFISLRTMVIPEDAPPEQIACMREAFFAGAQHLFGSIMSFLDPGKEPTDRDLQRLDKVNAELQRFIEQFKLQHTEMKGRA